ncbi:MAG: DUF1028 domain-containing protein [Bacteroidales bacterium]
MFKRRNLGVYLLLSVFFITRFQTSAQDTFSIVAIDSLTGEIGSAGASCVGSSISYPHGAAILSDIIPGVGAIHTQAAWDHTNQLNAHNWMMMGLSPQQMIDSLVLHDAGNNPTTRQYGIVDYNGGHPRSAAYTGINCMNYKNDTAHIYYSIQGNILLGQQILDSMQNRFLTTPGSLADRLMATLQGAKVIGADTRCAPRNTSSQSAFLRVAQMNNQADSLYLDLWMAYPQNLSGIFPTDPIDSLQTLYNAWKTAMTVAERQPLSENRIKVQSTPEGKTIFDFTGCKDYLNQQLVIINMTGRVILETKVTGRMMEIDLTSCSSRQVFAYRLIRKDHTLVASGKFNH